MLCESGEHGGSHTRSGAHYSGICVICEEQGKLARYDGETGRNGYYSYYRSTLGHKKDIEKNNDENAFAKHLAKFHPERIGDPTAFRLKLESTHKKKKCLERQITEGVHISTSEADHLLNSKSEYMQPAVRRVTTTREGRDRGA